ncbi:multidrug efflux pump subunit AcrB [Paraburkholderia sp. WC7.3d]
MSLSRPFILRPVATSLLMIALVLIGIVAVRYLPVSSLPNVDYPTIQVHTSYPGASPDVMATTVTAPLEVQLGEIPGLQQMTSYSSDGSSIITLQFDLSMSLDVAEQDVQQAINAANSYLPSGLPAPPTYAKVNPADQPILTLAVTSKSMSLTQLQDYANNRLGTKISEVPGVGLVTTAGGNVPAVRVEADPHRLAAYNLNLDDLRTLLANVNISQPKGNFDGPELDYTINDNDQISDPNDYLATIIAYQNGSPVYLHDVARVTTAAQDVAQGATYNRTPAILLNVQRQPGANVIATVDQIMKRLPALESTLPAGVNVTAVSNSTGVIRASVRDAAIELVMAVGLVVAVIFVFLRNVPATITPEHFGSRLADWHARGDVRAPLLDRQSLADGAHHRDRFRRRRLDRHDRERRPLSGGGGKSAAGGAQRSRADRVHDPLADGIADRRADSAAIHGRRHRASFQRVRRHARGDGRAVSRGFVDRRADALRTHSSGAGRASADPLRAHQRRCLRQDARRL